VDVERKIRKENRGHHPTQVNKAGAMQLMGCGRVDVERKIRKENRGHHPTGE
jgi:hypothetical protein